MNESCLKKKNESRLVYEWVMSHISRHPDRCQGWIKWDAAPCSLVWVMSRTDLECQWVMSHRWMRHVSYMNGSCFLIHSTGKYLSQAVRICEWVMSHIWMSHVSFMDESGLVNEWVVFSHTRGCNNGGGGWNFYTVNRLDRKCVGTRIRLFSGFDCFLPYPCVILESHTAGTFSKNLFDPLNHLCIFVPTHRLLEYPRTFGFGPNLSRWRSILWRFSALWRHRTRLASFFIVPKNCIF